MSKLSFSSSTRTKSSFNDTEIPVSDWSQVPAVRKRWNKLITGDERLGYESYFSANVSFHSRDVKMLSIGSGVCSHEMMLAQLNPDWDITCLDFSEKLLAEASRQAEISCLKNMHFLPEDIYTYEIP